jgi:hypothetical protein
MNINRAVGDPSPNTVCVRLATSRGHRVQAATSEASVKSLAGRSEIATSGSASSGSPNNDDGETTETAVTGATVLGRAVGAISTIRGLGSAGGEGTSIRVISAGFGMRSIPARRRASNR